ncbi:MAG: hypothetical protein ACOYVD_11740, partial [Bacillota bacterium]
MQQTSKSGKKFIVVCMAGLFAMFFVFSFTGMVFAETDSSLADSNDLSTFINDNSSLGDDIPSADDCEQANSETDDSTAQEEGIDAVENDGTDSLEENNSGEEEDTKRETNEDDFSGEVGEAAAETDPEDSEENSIENVLDESVIVDETTEGASPEDTEDVNSGETDGNGEESYSNEQQISGEAGSETDIEQPEINIEEAETSTDQTETNIEETETNIEQPSSNLEETESSIEEEQLADTNINLSIQDIINNAVIDEEITYGPIYVDGGIYEEDLIIDAEITPGYSGLELRASGIGGIPIINGQVVLSNLIGFIMQGFQVTGNITIKDSVDVSIEGTDADDIYKVEIQGSSDNIQVDGSGGNDLIKIFGMTGGEDSSSDNSTDSSIAVSGGSGDDKLEVDFSSGNPIGQNGLSYDGGDDYDVIAFTGGYFHQVGYQAINEHSGTILFDDTLVSYKNIEPILDTTPAENVTFECKDDSIAGSESTDDIINIINGSPLLDELGNPVLDINGNPIVTIEIQWPYEDVTFANKQNVTIDGLGGNDTFNLNLNAPSTGLRSFTIQGSTGIDSINIIDNDVLLPDVDLTLKAESIAVKNGTVRGKNIGLISEVSSGATDSFADRETRVDLINAEISASGSFSVTAASSQQKPNVSSGITESKETSSKVTVTDSDLTVGGNLSITAQALLDLELNGFIAGLPLEATLALGSTLAKVLIDGSSSLTSGGDILLRAISNIYSTSLAKSGGNIGSMAFAVSVLTSYAEAIVQGTSIIDSGGKVTIQAQNSIKSDTVADGYAGSESLGSSSIAVSVVNSTTRAGIYGNASLTNSSNVEIISESKNELLTASQSAVNVENSPIEDTLAKKDDEGKSLLDTVLQAQINAAIDKLAEGAGSDGSAGSGSAVQVAGALAYGYISGNTEASVSTPKLVKTSGLLDISTKALTNTSVLASGMTSGESVGIGAAVAVLTGTNINKAYINDLAQVQANSINIQALCKDFAPQDLSQIDAVNDFNVEAYAGQSTGNVGIGGALAFNSIVSKTEAFIGKGVTITVNGGNVVLYSTNDNQIETIADGAPSSDDEEKAASSFAPAEPEAGDESSEPAVGIGASVAITVASIFNSVFIDDNAIINGANDIQLSSNIENQVKNMADAGAAGGVAAVPVLALTLLFSQGLVQIGGGGSLELTGNLTAAAKNSSRINTKASGKAAGGNVGIGAAVAVNVLVDRTTATSSRALKAGGSVTVTAEGASVGSAEAEAGGNGGDADEPADGDEDPDTGGVDEQLNGHLNYMDGISTQQGAGGDSVPNQTPQSAETSQGKVNVAGAVALNIVNSIRQAYLPQNVTTGGILTLKSNNNSDASAKADSSSTDSSVGIGVAVAINVVTVKNEAYIGSGAVVTAQDLVIEAGMNQVNLGDGSVDGENAFTVEAISGAGASNVGVAGAVAINVLKNEYKAHVDGNVSLTGNAELKAENRSSNSASAGAWVAGEKAGVGASFAINIVVNDVLVYLADNAALAGAVDLELSADSVSDVETEANAGATASVASGVAVNGAVALTVVINNVKAYLGTNEEVLEFSGDLTVDSKNNSMNDTKASGKTAGGNVGVGAAVAVNVVVDRTIATTLRAVKAGGAVTLTATGISSSNATAEAGANGGHADEPADGDGDPETGGTDEQLNGHLNYMDGISSTQGVQAEDVPQKSPQSAATSEGKVNVAGAAALNIVTASTQAYITNDVTAGGVITIKANNNTDAKSKTDSSATDSGVGVGVAVAINVVTVKNEAYIGSSAVVNAQGLVLEAKMKEITLEDETTDSENTFSAEAISGAGAGKVGVAGSVAINVVMNQYLAHMDGSVTLTGGNAAIAAQGQSSSSAIAGTAVKASGETTKVGVGASFATNIINNKVLAYVADNASLTGAVNLTIAADLLSSITTKAIAGADPYTDVSGSEPAAGAKFALDAAVALTVVTNTVGAYSGTNSTINASGNVVITADSTSTTYTKAEGNASGKAAVGASLALNVINATTEAAVKGNASIGSSLSIIAITVNKDDVFALATARGLKIDRYLEKFATTYDNIINGNFGGEGGSSKPKSAQTLDQQGAKTGQTVDQDGSTTGGQSQKSISVAAAVGVNVMTHATQAYTGAGLVLVGGSIIVNSSSTSNFETLATGAAVTDGSSIAVGVAISNIYNETNAYLGSTNRKSEDITSYDITIAAVSTINMSDEYLSKLGAQAIAGAGSGTDGKIGAAGSLALINSGIKTQAYISPDAQISNAGIITIKVEETSKLAVRAWAASVMIGGASKVGVGAAFAVIYSNNTTSAYVGVGANVNAASLSLSSNKKRVDSTDFKLDFDSENETFTSNIFEGLELANFLSSNNYYGEAIAGAGSAGTAALAGAFVVMYFNNTIAAYIDDNAIVTINGNVNISSEADVNAKGIGGSAAGAQKAGIGLTTVNIINSDFVKAYIGSSAAVTSGGNIEISATADQELTIIAVSGSGASSTGAVGVFSIIFTKNVSTAFIGQGAIVKAIGSINIGASNDTHAYMVTGGASGGGSAGIGGSLAVLIIWNDAMAYIDRNAIVDSSSLLAINSAATELGIIAVISGAGGGSAGVAASGAIKIVKNHTLAYIAQGAQINTDEEYTNTNQAITISATDSTTLVGVSGSGSGGGTVGVGASIDTTVLIKTVKAYIADDIADDGINAAMVNAVGNIIVSAQAIDEIISLTAGFTGGGSVGVGGAVGIVVSKNDIQAYVGKEAVLRTEGSLAISANNDLTLVILAGSGAGGGSVGVGGSLAVSTIINSVQAYIGQNAKVMALGGGEAVDFYTGAAGKVKDTARGVLVGAYSTEGINIVVVSGSGGGAAGVAVSVGATVISNTTLAYIADGVEVNKVNLGSSIDQEVRLVAVDETELTAIIGSGSGGGAAGFGASSDTQVIGKTTKAYTGTGVFVAAQKNILISSLSKDVLTSAAVGFAGGGAAGIAGSVSVVVNENQIEAYAGQGTVLTSQGSINVKGTGNTTMVLTAGSAAGGGAAGVAASFAIAVYEGSTKAYLGSSTVVNAKGLLDVKADTIENVKTTAIGGSGGGAAGVAGSVAIKIIGNTTQAYIGENALINQDITYNSLSQSISIGAKDRIISIGISGAAAGGGAVGVGASSDVTILRNLTEAFIGKGAKVKAENNINVSAASEKSIDTLVVAAAGGGTVGVAGAVSIVSVGSLFDTNAANALRNSQGEGSTQGSVDDQISASQVQDLLGNSSQAQETKTTIDSENAKIGISDDFDETSELALDSTRAYIGFNAVVVSGNDLTLSAIDSIKLSVLVGGASAGTVGVGGAVGIVTIKNNTEAFVNTGAQLSASGNITIKAINQEKDNTTYKVKAYAGSAGLVGIGAAVAYLDVNHTVRAYLNTGVNILNANQVNIQGAVENNLEATTLGASVGGGAVGASLSRAYYTGVVEASVGNSSSISDTASLTVSAIWKSNIYSSAKAGAAGIAAGNGSDALAKATPTVLSYLSDNADVNVSGDVLITAQSVIDGDALAYGVGAGGLTIGISLAKVVMTPVVNAYFANNVTIEAGNDITIKAAHNYDLNGTKRSEKGYASANASSGSLVGGTGAFVDVQHTAEVEAYIGYGAVITAGQDIILNSYGNIDAEGKADGNTYGVVGVGAVKVVVSAVGTVQSYVDSTIANPTSLTAGRDLYITALGVSTPDADSEQAAGGIIAGGGSTAESGSVLNVNIFLGRNPDSGGGGIFRTNTGSITSLAQAQGSSYATADGINVGGITVGVSDASSDWAAVVNVGVGESTVLNAKTNISLSAEHDNTTGSYASSSTGSLVGAVGSKSSSSSSATVSTNLGASSSLTAGGNINITADSSIITDAESSGYAYGVLAGGTSSTTNEIVNLSQAHAEGNAALNAGNDINFSAIAVSNARKSKAQGGSGGLISGTNTSAVTSINHFALATVDGGAVFAAANNNRILAQSSLDANAWAKISETAGAVTLNISKADIDIIALTQVDIGSNADISGKNTYLWAKVTRLNAYAYAYSKTYAADSTTQADAYVDVESLAKIIVRGGLVEGTDLLEMRARHDNVFVKSESFASIASGFTGVVNSTAHNDLYDFSFIDVQSSSKLYSTDILLEAVSPHSQDNDYTGHFYVKNADSEAATVINFVDVLVKKFKTVVEKVTKYLPWPLNKIVKWVTKTVAYWVWETIKQILHSDVNESEPGSYLSDNKVNLQGDIYLGNARGVSLTINEDNTMISRGEVSAYISGSEIIVNPFNNNQLSSITINAPRGAVSGNAVIHKNAVITEFEIINNSNLNLRVSSISLVNNNPPKPDLDVYAGDERDTSNFTYVTDITEMPLIAITGTKATNVTFAGLVENQAGRVNVTTAGGNISFLTGSVIEANKLLLSTPLGRIGENSASQGSLYMYKGEGRNPVLELNTGGDAYLRVLLREVRAVSSSAPINGLEISQISVGGNLNIYALEPEVWTLNEDDTITLVKVTGIYKVGSISADNNVDVELAAGDLELVGGISAGETLNLTVSGSILDGGDALGADLIAPVLKLTAGNSIGNSSNYVDTDLAENGTMLLNAGNNIYINEKQDDINLEAKAQNGNVLVNSSGNITIGGISSQLGVSAGGAINITATKITVGEDITGGGQIVLTTTDLSGEDNDLLIVSGNTINSQGDNVILRAGDDIKLENGAVLKAANGVTLSTDYANGDTGLGGKVELYGEINAATLTITGAGDNDTILINSSKPMVDTTVQAGGGDDQITLNSISSGDGSYITITLDGQAGSDSYLINFVGSGNYIISVNDSGLSGNDYLTLNGSDSTEEILIRKYFIALINSGIDSDSDGYDDVERINYNETIEHVYINTFGANDYIYSDDTSTYFTIDGGDGDDMFRIAQVFKSPRDGAAGVAPGDELETLETTRGFLSKGISVPMTIYGGNGNDQFQVYHNQAVLQLYGEAGNDKFLVRAFVLLDESLKQKLTNIDSGGDADEITYSVNAPVEIDGGVGVDTVIVLLTEFADSVVITDEGVFGAGLTISYSGVERVEVDGMEGDDTFFILSTSADVITVLIGNRGRDTFIIAGDITDSIETGSGVIFPDATHNTGSIAGELIIDGGIIEGSDRALSGAITLPTETNEYVPDGIVSEAGSNTLTDASGEFGTYTNRFVGIIDEHGELAQIRRIVSNTTTTLTLEKAWDALPGAGVKYVIFFASPTLFVDEATQQDIVKVYNDRSTTNDSGVLTENKLTGLRMAFGIEYDDLELIQIWLGIGNDTFTVNNTALNTNTEINGNLGQDIFNLYQAQHNLTVRGDEGEDQFNVVFNTNAGFKVTLNGGTDNDTFNLQSINHELEVNGGEGNDVFDVQFDTTTSSNVTLSGGTHNDIFNLKSANHNLVVNGDEHIDTFNVDFDATTGSLVTLNGGADNDVFNLLSTNHQLEVNGNGGQDQFNVEFDNKNGVNVTLNGGGDNDIFLLKSINHDLVASGDGGNDSFTVEFNDYSGANVTLNGGSDNDYFSLRSINHELVVNGDSGDDTFDVELNNYSGRNVHLNGGSNNDTFNLYSTNHETVVNGDDGNDTFNIAFSALTIPTVVLNGGLNDDLFKFADGIVLHGDINGGLGLDTLDFSDYTTARNVLLQNWDTEGFIGIQSAITEDFSGIDRLIGSPVKGINGDRLDGIADKAGEWILDGDNSTYRELDKPISINFRDYEFLYAEDEDDLFVLMGAEAGRLYGGAGHDTFLLWDGASLDGNIDGGGGINTLDYSSYTTPVNVDLSTFSATNISVSIVGIQNVYGGQGNDYLKGYNGDNILAGNGGDDTLEGVSGDNIYLFGNKIYTTHRLYSYSNDFGVDRIIQTTWGKDTLDFTNITGDLRYELADHKVILGSNNVDYSNDGDAPSNIRLFKGGSGKDTFVFIDGFILPAGTSIDGGKGEDTLDFSEYLTACNIQLNSVGTDGFSGTQQAIPAGFTNINHLLGSQSGADTITGLNTSSIYTIGVNHFLSNSGITMLFSGYEHLVSGSGKDSFVFTGSGELAGSIDGGLGIDEMDYSGYDSGVIVNLLTGKATGLADGET